MPEPPTGPVSGPAPTTPAASAAPVSGAPGPAPFATPKPTPPPPGNVRANAKGVVQQDDLLLMALFLDDQTVTESFAAYGSQDDPLIPVGELARLLDININVLPGEGRIIGTVGEAQRPLTIDIGTQTYRLNGKGIALAPEDFAVTPTEIYLRASAVEKVLPIQLKINVESLEVHLHPLERLPIQARAERLAQLRDLHPDVAGAEESLRIPTPYRLFTPPAFDISGQIGASVIAPRFPHSFDIRVANDLLYTGFQGYAGSDQNGKITSARVVFSRQDPKGNLLGPLHATSASIGDVDTPGLAIGPRGGSGRGFQFSTAPLEQTSVFNRIDLRGELPVGYDVELYINDVLRSGQRTPTQGRYEFLNVPLVQGVNVIRIVTNGPRGERTEETKIINVGGGQVPKGQLSFAFGVVQQNQGLIPLGQQDLVNPATAATSDLTQPGLNKMRVTASVAYGLSTTVTLVGGAATFPAVTNPDTGATTQREVVTGGVRTGLFGASLQMDAALDSNRGGAVAVGAAAKIFGVSTVLRQVLYRGQFIDENTGLNSIERPILSHSEIDTDFNVRAMQNTLIPLSLRGTFDYYTDHSSAITGGFRTSASVHNILMSGGFDLTASNVPGSPMATTVVGNLAASTFYQFSWQLRAGLNYNVLPNFAVQDLNVTADHDIGNAQSIRLGLGQGLTATGGTSLQAGDVLHTKLGDLALTGNYTIQNRQWSLGASFAVGLVFDPYAKKYILTRAGPSSTSSVAFQTFIDANGNGIYDPGEMPVSGATVDGGVKKAITDSNGRAFIVGGGTGVSSRLQVGLDNIDDPFVKSPPHIITFTPRPGLVVKAPFPLVNASEVILHVVLKESDRSVGLSAVRIRLVAKGKPPLEGSTEFDGSVGFESLGTGSYDLELDPEQAGRLHMRLVAPVKVVVPPAGGLVPDVTAEVMFDRPAGETTQADPAEPAQQAAN